MAGNLANLLIVEDEPVTGTPLEALFKKEGYNVYTSRSMEGAAGALSQAAENAIDVCLVDANLPSDESFALARQLRASSDVGIILLTGASGPVDRIAGLESGADDCIARPVDPTELLCRELLCRVKNLSWRVQTQRKHKEAGFTRQFAGWTLDLNRRELQTPGGERLALSGSQFRLLLALIENAGEVVSRDQLMRKIRNREWHPWDRYIDVLVGQVRRKFRQHDSGADFITTIHGTGYLFAPAVT